MSNSQASTSSQPAVVQAAVPRIELREDDSDPRFGLTAMSSHGVYDKDVFYGTADQMYQALKFIEGNRPDIAVLLRAARNPIEARQIATFFDLSAPSNWLTEYPYRRQGVPGPREPIAVAKMYVVMAAKFAQHPHLKDMLLDTKNAALVLRSNDPFWGLPDNSEGSNWFGRVLQDVRYLFQNPPPAG